MTVINALSQIVRPLDGGEKLKADEITRRARPPVGRLRDLPGALLGRRYGLRFRVETATVRSHIPVVDELRNETISVTVVWRTKLRNDANRLLDALVVSTDDALQIAETRMGQHLNARARARGETRLGQWVHNNAASLSDELRINLGEIDLDAQVMLPTDTLRTESLRIPSFSFEVRTKDSSRRLTVELDLLLDPTAHPSERAPKNVDAWQVAIRADVSDYIERNETIEAYYRDSDLDVRVDAHLRTRVEKLGWTIARFGMTRKPLPDAARISDIFKVNWTSADSKSFGFGVKVDLDVAPGGVQKLDAAGWPDLRTWTDRNLQDCFKEVLFDRDKDKLSPASIDELRGELQQNLQRRADAVGLKVRTLIPDPEIAEWEFLSNRQYPVKARDYATHNPAQLVNFEMTITGHFMNIGAVFKVKEDSDKLRERIAEVAAEAAAHQMQREEPRVYFSAFMPPPPEMPSPPPIPATGYLRDRLEEAVARALRERMGFAVKDIHFLRLDPRVRERIQALCDMPAHKVEVKVLPAGVRAEEFAVPLDMMLQYMPPPVDYIANYMSHNLQPEQMAELIHAKIVQVLEGLSPQELSLADEGERVAMANRLSDRLNSEMSYRGLGVRIESIRRRRSRVEEGNDAAKWGKLQQLRDHQTRMFSVDLKQIEDETEALNRKSLDHINNDRSLDSGDIDESRRRLGRKTQDLLQQAQSDQRQITHESDESHDKSADRG